MSNQVQYLKAKKCILDTFHQHMDAIQAGSAISDVEMVSLLDLVNQTIPWRKSNQKVAIEMFLFAGARRFDRWTAPTPFVVPPTHHQNFIKFVNAFRKQEGSDTVNCPIFDLHAVRDDIFIFFDKSPLEKIEASATHQFRDRIKRVSQPLTATKKIEFNQQRNELMGILDGLDDKSLRTELRFRVPYILHREKLQLDFDWHGVMMQATVEPNFSPTNDTFFQPENGAAVSAGASRWQGGTSQVALTLSCLLDGSARTERLQAMPNAELPSDAWPQSFTWAFSIFHDLFWTLRAKNIGQQNWIPSPRDISDLTQVFSTAKIGKFGLIIKGSPASLYEIFTPSSSPLSINLGKLQRLSWSTECRTRADMYLELGDTNEALFWMNVATEALIAERFTQIESWTQRPGLAESLGSPKEFWADAEAIVTKQFPEMQGRVKWPTTPIHASVFGKLKALYRLVPMSTSCDELITKYRIISGQRNDLFHGKTTERVSVSTIQAAREALNWIDQRMRPQHMPTTD
ncbi:hypothetical protein [Cupriavidus sp. D384]|uniref:hypothetical protein n=1 Tax=Cupriavidus sp. D384 TaxID=1538095 RepID=UPI000A756106|nr:hypothetical protein [Cupriavidus sp. D384]